MKTMFTFATVLSLAAVFTLSGNQVQAQAHTALASNQVYEKSNTHNMYYEEQSKSFQAAIFPRKNGMVSVNVAKDANETVKIRVISSNGTLLNEESIKKNNLVAKQYSLSGFPKGTYTFEVASDKKMIRKEITLE